MANIGYARVSTVEQNLDLQRDALKAAGCERIFTDQGISGKSAKRPGLDRALKALQPGDTLVTWKLDRLFRSLSHLVQLVEQLGERNIAFRSVNDPIDTGSASGRLTMHILAAMAEFERSLIVERTSAGLAAAKRRGVKLGRPRKLTPSQVSHARTLMENGAGAAGVAQTFGISRRTLFYQLKNTAA